jgi:hypothetical protein
MLQVLDEEIKKAHEDSVELSSLRNTLADLENMVNRPLGGYSMMLQQQQQQTNHGSKKDEENEVSKKEETIKILENQLEELKMLKEEAVLALQPVLLETERLKAELLRVSDQMKEAVETRDRVKEGLVKDLEEMKENLGMTEKELRGLKEV